MKMIRFYTHPLHHTHTPVVILGLMISGSFFMSAKAASGRPQFATTGREVQQCTVWLAMTSNVDTARLHTLTRTPEVLVGTNT